MLVSESSCRQWSDQSPFKFPVVFCPVGLCLSSLSYYPSENQLCFEPNFYSFETVLDFDVNILRILFGRLAARSVRYLSL